MRRCGHDLAVATSRAPGATARLRIRAAVSSDAELFTRLLTDTVVRRYLGGPLAGPRLAEKLARIEAPGAFVVELVDATPVGAVAVGRRPTGERELSYEFLPEHWGNGYAQEACGSVLRWALRDDEEDGRVVAVTQVANSPSLVLLGRLGMTEVDRFEEWGEPQVMLAIRRGRGELRP
jgi:RimJ/RimL family protein N-acetyltransferase